MYLFDFLKEPLKMNFEAYTYGPFCREIPKILEDMEIDGDVILERNNISLARQAESDEKKHMRPEDKERLDRYLNIFYNDILQGNISFGRVELYGTVMYVMDVLDVEAGCREAPPTLPQVFEAVLHWKKNKFSKRKIEEAYLRISEHLWHLRTAA